MIELIQKLLSGDPNIPAQMEKAKSFWDDFFEQYRDLPVKDLAKKLSLRQARFESDVFDSNRFLAKMLMPVTCLGSIYNVQTGWDENLDLAVKTVQAFAESSCSLEVKSATEQAVGLYMLGDHIDAEIMASL
jgi:hypothetical protein